jgi:hypothetical protein
MVRQPGQNNLLPIAALPARSRVSPLRNALRLRCAATRFLLLGPVSVDSLCPTDLSGRSSTAARRTPTPCRPGVRFRTSRRLDTWTENIPRAGWANPKTGLSSEVWSEGLGWYALVIPETLAVLPKAHPQRSEVEDIYRAAIAVPELRSKHAALRAPQAYTPAAPTNPSKQSPSDPCAGLLSRRPHGLVLLRP